MVDPPTERIATPAQGVDVRGILGMLRRRLWLIVITTLVVVGVAGGITATLKKVYSASALVLFDPSSKDLLADSAQMPNWSDTARVDSEVELARSDATISRVVEAYGLVKDDEFGVQISLWDKLLAFFRIAEPTMPSADALVKSVTDQVSKAVSVRRNGLTYVMAFQATTQSPEKSAMLANALAETYIRMQLEGKIASVQTAYDVVTARIASAQTALEGSERAFDGFIDSNLDAIATATGSTKLADIRRQLSASVASADQMRSTVTRASAALDRGDWTTVSNALASDAVQQYELRRQELEKSLAGAAEGSLGVVDLRAELAKVQQQLATEARQAVAGLQNGIAEAQARSTDLRTELRTTVQNSDLPAGLRTDLYRLLREGEIAKSQYDALLANQKDFDARTALQVPDSRIASPAVSPSDASFPNVRVILALAAAMGLGLGLALAFSLENFVGGFTDERQLEAVSGAKVVAAIPRLRPLRVNEQEATVSSYVPHAPLSVFAETVRRARIGIDQALRRNRGTSPENCAVVMVASSPPRERKTTLAPSLARTYAPSGVPTLLIDCDLRKPGVHQQLGIAPSSGLLDYLAKGSDAPELTSIMVADDESGAQVIPGSRRSDIPTDQLLASASFARLVKAAQRSFDIVILDTAPVGPVVDSLYIAPLADVVAFVVRWAATPQQDVKEAMQALSDAKSPGSELVAILSQQRSGIRGYYNKSKYAGYYSDR